MTKHEKILNYIRIYSLISGIGLTVLYVYSVKYSFYVPLIVVICMNLIAIISNRYYLYKKRGMKNEETETE